MKLILNNLLNHKKNISSRFIGIPILVLFALFTMGCKKKAEEIGEPNSKGPDYDITYDAFTADGLYPPSKTENITFYMDQTIDKLNFDVKTQPGSIGTTQAVVYNFDIGLRGQFDWTPEVNELRPILKGSTHGFFDSKIVHFFYEVSGDHTAQLLAVKPIGVGGSLNNVSINYPLGSTPLKLPESISIGWSETLNISIDGISKYEVKGHLEDNDNSSDNRANFVMTTTVTRTTDSKVLEVSRRSMTIGRNGKRTFTSGNLRVDATIDHDSSGGQKTIFFEGQ